MQITLTYEEKTILGNYHRYLWRVHHVSMTNEEMIHRLIKECGVEVDLMNRELEAEDKRNS